MIWITYCILEGIAHGFFYHKQLQKHFNFNEHIIWNVMRGILMFVICYQLYEPGGLMDVKWQWILVFMFTVQPFFHNGAYYTTRYLLGHKKYRKWWFAQSTTSTSKFTKLFTPRNRTFFVIFGLICLYISYKI